MKKSIEFIGLFNIISKNIPEIKIQCTRRYVNSQKCEQLRNVNINNVSVSFSLNGSEEFESSEFFVLFFSIYSFDQDFMFLYIKVQLYQKNYIIFRKNLILIKGQVITNSSLPI